MKITLNVKSKISKGLFLSIGIFFTFVFSYTLSFAKTTDSIFKDVDYTLETSPLKRTLSPAQSEQTRYAEDIPVVDMQDKLSEAEKYIGYLIEEHNRRIDMMSMQETYIENLTSRRIASKYNELLTRADNCNARQLLWHFTKYNWERDGRTGAKRRLDSVNYILAQVPLSGIRDVCSNNDKWCNRHYGSESNRVDYSYPYVTGPDIWNLAMSRYVLGTYTRELNEAKAAAGVWAGSPYDPVTLDCNDWRSASPTTSKYAICEVAERRGLLSGGRNLAKFINLRGMRELINGKYVTPSMPSSSDDWTASSEWERFYGNLPNITLAEGETLADNNSFIDFWELSNVAARQYRKERWKVGYQLLMDIYHNEKFGTPPNREDKLWPDQKKRYLTEVLENYKKYYIDHYYHAGLTHAQADNELYFKEKYFDYYEHNPGGEWYNIITNFISKWQSANQSQSSWTCCKVCDCEEGPCCCCTWRLTHTPTPRSAGGNAPRSGTSCGDTAVTDLQERIQIVPRPLIWNVNRSFTAFPAVSESIYIDSRTNGRGGYKDYYQVDEMRGEFPLLANGATSGQVTSVPNVWRNLLSGSGEQFNVKEVYENCTFNKDNVPPRNVKESYWYYTSTCHTYSGVGRGVATRSLADFRTASGTRATKTDFKLSDLEGEYPQIFEPDNLPMNQNRIQVYMDIYESYVNAKDNETRLTHPLTGQNAKINSALNTMLDNLREQIQRGHFGAEAKRFNEERTSPAWTVSSGDIANPNSMNTLYEESLVREDFFYRKAKELINEVTEGIIETEGKPNVTYAEAYTFWKNNEEPATSPLATTAESEGPIITASDSPKDTFLQRMARVYQTLYYFGEGDNLSSNVTYKPNPQEIQNAINNQFLDTRNISSLGKVSYSVERIRDDGSFEVPVYPTTQGWTGQTSRTFNPAVTVPAFETTEDNYVKIGVTAPISDKFVGKKIGELNKNDAQLITQMNKERTERLKASASLYQARQTRANNIASEMLRTARPSQIDFSISSLNFNDDTCLFNTRSGHEVRQ